MLPRTPHILTRIPPSPLPPLAFNVRLLECSDRPSQAPSSAARHLKGGERLTILGARATSGAHAMKRVGWAALGALAMASCSTTGPTAPVGDAGGAAPLDAGSTVASDERLTAILTAEHRRFAGGVSEADQRS